MKERILEIVKNNPLLSNREIGKIVGLSRNTVAYYMKQLGIHRDRKLMQKNNNTSRQKICTITDNAEQIILGSILGDGYISEYTRPENSKLLLNSQLRIVHGLKQEQYIKYKSSLLEREGLKCHLHYIDKTNYKEHYIKGILVKEVGSWTMQVQRNVSFNKYRQMFYKNRIKYINRYIYRLNALGLAIWYMDDGCYNNNGIHLYTNCFNNKDLILLQNMLKHNFNLDTTLQNCSSGGKAIYIKASSKKQFLKIIEPYICDCMKYKLGV